MLIAATQRRRARTRRLLHDDEARALQVLDKALRDDSRHDLACVMFPLEAVETQRDGEGVAAAGVIRHMRAKEALAIR